MRFAVCAFLLIALSACGKKEAAPAPETPAPAAAVAPKPAAKPVAPEKKPEPKAQVAPAEKPKAEATPVITQPARDRVGTPFIDHFKDFDEGRWLVSDGWSNADWMTSTFRRAGVDTAPEGLVLKSERAPDDTAKPYTAAEIRTREDFRYGYFESRMKMPKSPGLIAGFFAYAPASDGKYVQEIDVELLGYNTRQVELTIHMGGAEGLNTNTEIVHLPFDAAEGFHTYGFDWRPDAIRFYVDGKLLRTVKKKDFAMPDRELIFFVDLWATQRLVKWAGGAPRGEGPWPLTLNCVAYQAAYKGRPVC